MNSNCEKHLSNDEQRKLFIKYNQGDLEARKTLIETNLYLVNQIIKKYFYDSKENYEDLFQYGCIALIETVDNFDLSKNASFLSYAYPCIKGKLIRAMEQKMDLIRIPVYVKVMINKISEYRDLYYKKHGFYPSDLEIASEFDISLKNVHEYLSANKEILPLTEELMDNEYNENSYLKFDMNLIDDSSIETDFFKEEIVNILKNINITVKDKSILENKYGFNNQKIIASRELAKKYNKVGATVEIYRENLLKKIRQNIDKEMTLYCGRPTECQNRLKIYLGILNIDKDIKINKCISKSVKSIVTSSKKEKGIYYYFVNKGYDSEKVLQAIKLLPKDKRYKISILLLAVENYLNRMEKFDEISRKQTV